MDAGSTWSTPLALAVVLVALGSYLAGYLRLRARGAQLSRRRWSRRLAAWAIACGLTAATLLPPLSRFAMESLPWHMAVHVLLMFFVPLLAVLGAPRVPLQLALPVERRRGVLRAASRWRASSASRALRRALRPGWLPVVALIAVMGFWHLPGPYGWAASRMWAHQLVMAPSFILSGWAFWRLLVAAHPRPARATPAGQILAVVAVAASMLFLAVAMGVASSQPWYDMDVAMQGAPAALSAQRRAAGILWVCGDLWAVPAIAVLGWRLASGGEVSSWLERRLGREA